MHPTYPRLLPDRDKRFKWYLDEPVVIHLKDDHELHLPKGYRFDGHSLNEAIKVFFFSGLVAWFLGWLIPMIFAFFLVFFALYLKYQYKRPRDLEAAMVHDALVDFESLHRFNRKYIDDVYTMYMRKPEYYSNKWRAFWMPFAVKTYGFLRFTAWGDYRGEPKPGTKIIVTVED